MMIKPHKIESSKFFPYPYANVVIHKHDSLIIKICMKERYVVISVYSPNSIVLVI